MKYILGSILFSVLVVFCVSSQGKTLLVSDVDDTIKLAHVKDYGDALKYAFDDESRFLGMSFLYTQILNDQSDSQVVYLSKGPARIVGKTHRELLAKGQFPKGQYIPRTEYDADVHKIKNLRALLDDIKPDKVILIGDNGEQDADVYAQIVKEYSNRGIDFFQFIRIVYSRNSYAEKGAVLHEGQVGFISPVEVALELEKKYMIRFSTAQEIIDKVVPEIIKQKFSETKGVVAVPYFVNCEDFQWKWDDRENQFAPLSALKLRLANRCKLKL